MVIERATVDFQVLVKILVGAHLGPGGIDAQRQDGQQDINNPYPKEILGIAGKGYLMSGRFAHLLPNWSINIYVQLKPAAPATRKAIASCPNPI
ncbi:hypothetical protein [Actibacterium mucosum]|uniref:hypothetical protein n=1 Tax=Actibacterium mucosum TaxID=1087332 RepID=UPI001F1C1501|nr:hypothetical protein [Actibacterium mucosum]